MSARATYGDRDRGGAARRPDAQRVRGLRPAAARQPGRRRQLLRGHRRVPRRAQPRAALAGQGQRRHRRRGRRDRPRGLARRPRSCASRTTSSCPPTSIADIRQTSLLGEKYVELVPAGQPSATAGSAGRLGGRRRARRWSPPAATPSSRRCSARCRCSSTAAASGSWRSITREINEVFDGRQDRVRSVLRELDTLVGGLDEQKEDIISAMESINGLASTLNEEKETVVGRARRVRPGRHGAGRPARPADPHAQGARPARRRRHPRGRRHQGGPARRRCATSSPIVREIADVDDQIPEALGLLDQLPVPDRVQRHRLRRLRQHLDRLQPRPEQPVPEPGGPRHRPARAARRRAADRPRRPARRAPAGPRRPPRRSRPGGGGGGGGGGNGGGGGGGLDLPGGLGRMGNAVGTPVRPARHRHARGRQLRRAVGGDAR